jgi:hypothetical protein
MSAKNQVETMLMMTKKMSTKIKTMKTVVVGVADLGVSRHVLSDLK